MSRDGKSEKLSLVASFVHELLKLREAGSSLKITISNFSVFDSISLPLKNASGSDWDNEIENSERFDFILGDHSPRNGKKTRL